jgi:hypothetical protein
MKQTSPDPTKWVGTTPLKDEPIITNAAGGRQSYTPYRLDLISPTAMLNLGAILALGAERYGEWNWINIPSRDHINHALVHIEQHLAEKLTGIGDGEDHIGHAFCRLMFAVHQAHTEELRKAEQIRYKEEAERIEKTPRTHHGTPYQSSPGGSWGED